MKELNFFFIYGGDTEKICPWDLSYSDLNLFGF